MIPQNLIKNFEIYLLLLHLHSGLFLQNLSMKLVILLRSEAKRVESCNLLSASFKAFKSKDLEAFLFDQKASLYRAIASRQNAVVNSSEPQPHVLPGFI